MVLARIQVQHTIPAKVTGVTINILKDLGASIL
jgi:hypothetical protein